MKDKYAPFWLLILDSGSTGAAAVFHEMTVTRLVKNKWGRGLICD
jgi:hypothetical protein